MKKEHTNIGPQKLYVEEYIPEKQTYPSPLVLVHGSFGGAFMWGMIAMVLVKEGFHMYALTLRGHKGSAETNLGEVGMSDYVADVKDVVDAFQLENPVVIGHSMSGLVVLMFALLHPARAVVSIDPSPSVEVKPASDESAIAAIPDVYTPMDAGMPTDPMLVMKALSDIPQEMLMKMKDMLGPESGKARRDRKRGISVSKETLKAPVLFVGAELGDSVPFGISLESSKKMAEYYGAEFREVKGATHPGILMGKHSNETAEYISTWLKNL